MSAVKGWLNWSIYRLLWHGPQLVGTYNETSVHLLCC